MNVYAAYVTKEGVCFWFLDRFFPSPCNKLPNGEHTTCLVSKFLDLSISVVLTWASLTLHSYWVWFSYSECSAILHHRGFLITGGKYASISNNSDVIQVVGLGQC